jgi:hypothetical protein
VGEIGTVTRNATENQAQGAALTAISSGSLKGYNSGIDKRFLYEHRAIVPFFGRLSQ